MIVFVEVQRDLQLSDDVLIDLLPMDADIYEVDEIARAQKLSTLPSTSQKRLLGLCFNFFPVESLYSEKVQDYLRLSDEQTNRIDQLVLSMPTRDDEFHKQMLSDGRSVAWWYRSREDMYSEIEDECMNILNLEQQELFVSAKVDNVLIPMSDWFPSPLFDMDELAVFRSGLD